MVIEVQSDLVEIVSVNVANEALVKGILLDDHGLRSHLTERINDNRPNDGCQDQVDKNEVGDIEQNPCGRDQLVFPEHVHC
jgi:hypothetical protein